MFTRILDFQKEWSQIPIAEKTDSEIILNDGLRIPITSACDVNMGMICNRSKTGKAGYFSVVDGYKMMSNDQRAIPMPIGRVPCRVCSNSCEFGRNGMKEVGKILNHNL